MIMVLFERFIFFSRLPAFPLEYLCVSGQEILWQIQDRMVIFVSGMINIHTQHFFDSSKSQLIYGWEIFW